LVGHNNTHCSAVRQWLVEANRQIFAQSLPSEMK